MSIINHILIMKREEEKINKEISRNHAIVDEVSELALALEFTREVIEENLLFDYFIREEESNYLMIMCDKTNVDYKELSKMIQIESVRYLKEDVSAEDLFEMKWGDVANSLIRLHKKLILLKIEERYYNLYSMVLVRAKETADKILKGVC